MYEVKFLLRGGEYPAAQLLVHAEEGGMRRTGFFWSKEDGQQRVMKLFAEKQVTLREKNYLLGELERSPLPETERQAREMRKRLHAAASS